MTPGFTLRAAWVVTLAFVLSLPARAQTADPSNLWLAEVRDLVEQLHRVALDPQAAFRVKELYLRRDALRLELTRGTLVFFRPVAGVVTGALFVGEGRILVMPPLQSEREQLARFTGSPILAELFSSAYFRFTDATDTELRAHLRAGRGTRENAAELSAQWNGVVQTLNPAHSLRVLADLLSKDPRPYFSATLSNRRRGRFDAVRDDRLNEEILLRQASWRNDRLHHDIWCSFPREGRVLPGGLKELRPQSYRIQTTIRHDHSLAGTTDVHFRARGAGDRTVVFELSRLLEVQEVTDASGQPLLFYQNETLAPEQLRTLGSDHLIVVLPEPLRTDTVYTFRFRYRGQVITDIGNGVLYVGARGIWYPNLYSPWPAPYEMDFRYPRALALVASGQRVAQSEEGAWRTSRWVSEVPLPLAGFNLGAYDSHERVYKGIPVSVHANRQLEPALARPFTAPPPPPLPDVARVGRPGENPRPPRPYNPDLLLTLPNVAPQPSAQVQEVGEEVGQALEFFVTQFGNFPYPRLHVSQIPGRFGQGYPGLLYLSTFTFLQGRDQARLGLSERTREHFSGLVPAHETAHQWWGTRVRVADYRDQWLIEALATYSSLLYLESKSDGPGMLREWLVRYRDDLLAQSPDRVSWEAAGPLALGRRLNSSLLPGSYERVVYPKGAWVLHMLRHLLSDKVFFDLLRSIAGEYGDKPFSTAALQTLAEARMPRSSNPDPTGSLEWFFDQWVYNTGIPHYRLEARVQERPQGGFRVTGRIRARGVSDLFMMPVPVYARTGRQLRLLGRVVVSGPEASFSFVTQTRPDRVVLDPHQSILCVIEP